MYVIYGVPSLSLNVGGNGTANVSSSSYLEASTNTWVTNTTTTTTFAYANYTSGNGTSELLFAYTVEAGDATDDLDYSTPSADALSAPFGSIVAKDTLEPVYLRSLPEPGATGSLGWSKDIVVSDEVLLVERVSKCAIWCTVFYRIYDNDKSPHA